MIKIENNKFLFLVKFFVILSFIFFIRIDFVKADFTCGDSVTFTYRGSSETYGTVLVNNNCWLDRNLGAERICGNPYDEPCYGDLFQWGRLDDGHQDKFSSTTPTTSNANDPFHSNFITTSSDPFDWRAPQNNNLWQEEDCENNPCPSGWRVPTINELRQSIDWNNPFNSILKVPYSNIRHALNGNVLMTETRIWSSTISANDTHSSSLRIKQGQSQSTYSDRRSYGLPIRCIKNIDYYSLSYNTTFGGTILGETNQQVMPGEDGEEVEAVANSGYRFVRWSDGIETNKRTDTNILDNLSVEALFELNPAENISPITDTREKDLIATRVLPNPNNYSIETWYRKQGFTGSPQSLVVDGYQAIRDGRTIYVNAANVDKVNNKIYTNIYLISHNQDPDIKTVDILARIAKNWQFNRNLINDTDIGFCNIPSQRCRNNDDCAGDLVCFTGGPGEFGYCRIPSHDNLQCLNDSDCPSGIYCDSLKAKVTRDVRRLGALTDLRESLERYKSLNGNYPILASGTYIRHHSLSVWPSWQQLFLPQIASSNKIDPINILGDCPTYDPITCWNESLSKFYNHDGGLLILPADSYSFLYSSNSNGSNFDLCAVLESVLAGYENAEGNLFEINCITEGTGFEGIVDLEAPSLHSYNLKGSVNQEFSGFIRVNNPSGHPLTWNLTASGGSGWSAAPVLQDTSSPNQKRVWAQTAGSAGTYPITINVHDSEGNSFTESLNIEITGSVPFIEMPNIEYFLNPTKPLKFTAKITDSFPLTSSNISLSNIGVGTTIIDQEKIGDTTLLHYQRLISSGDFPQDEIRVGSVNASNNLGATSSRNFNLNLRVTRPIMDFVCLHQARIGKYYECFLGWAKQGDFDIDYWTESELPPELVIEKINYSPNFECGYPVNHEGQSYSTVKIGDQCWFAENVNVGEMIDSSQNQDDPNIIQKWCYDNDQDNCQIYGGLYQWKQAQAKGICPNRWRLATDEDWKNLERNIGMDEDEVNFSGHDPRGTNEGKILRSTDFGGTNNYGFNILGAGEIVEGNVYTNINFISIFWTQTNILRLFSSDFNGIARQSFSGAGNVGNYGYSIRCITEDYWVLRGEVAEPEEESDIGKTYEIDILAKNNYNTQNNRQFNLEINSFCGDGIKQNPNTEGRGGFYNDGNEDCDVNDGITSIAEHSNVNLQYGCNMGPEWEAGNQITPYPILTGNYCVFKAPLLGGGFCGDGFCQTTYETSENCPQDCGEGAAIR